LLYDTSTTLIFDWNLSSVKRKKKKRLEERLKGGADSGIKDNAIKNTSWITGCPILN